MGRTTRRQLLALGAVGAGTLLSRGTWALHRQASSIEELALAFRTTPRSQVFDVAAKALRAGTPRDVLLGAVFRAGVEEVRPRPHGILHCVMEVESNFQLAEASPSPDSWLPVLWNLDDFKRSQERDAREDGDWKLAARPEVRFPSEAKARAEFLAAMDAWDPERADRAIVGLLPYHDRASLFEVLWPMGLRCYAFIGHKSIYVAQLHRTLGRVGWAQAEPALRSLVATVLVDRNTEDFEASTTALRELGPLEGQEDAAASEALALELLHSSPEEARTLALAALSDGLHPDSIWDACRLAGSEVFLHRPGITSDTGRNALLPVHAVTVPEALGHVARTSPDPELQRLALLQAVSFTARLHADLQRMVGLRLSSTEKLALQGDPEEEASHLDDLLRAPTPARAHALLTAQPELTPAYVAALRSSLLRRGREHHQHKYAAATFEEAQRMTGPHRVLLLAAGVEYLATPSEPTSEVYDRSQATLRAAGLL